VAPKPAGEQNVGKNAASTKEEEPEVEKEVNLPQPGSEGHLVAKNKANLPANARNFAINTPEGMAAHLAATVGTRRQPNPPERCNHASEHSNGSPARHSRGCGSGCTQGLGLNPG